MSHPIFNRLKAMIESPSNSMEWFSMAEQAINAIYLLGNHPDNLCGEIIKTKSNEIFKDKEIESTENDTSTNNENENESENENAMDIDDETINNSQLSTRSSTIPSSTFQKTTKCTPYVLSQLFFLVGHIALKQTVHLEVIEAAWKRKKSKLDGKDSK